MQLLRHGRIALVIAALVGLALPAVAFAKPAPTAPPPAVVDWQTHLAHMQAMAGPLGWHVTACIADHGSLSGMFGPNGSMTEMIGEVIE